MCCVAADQATLGHAHIVTSPRLTLKDNIGAPPVLKLWLTPVYGRYPRCRGASEHRPKTARNPRPSGEQQRRCCHHLRSHHGGPQPLVPGTSSVPAPARPESGERAGGPRSPRCPDTTVPPEEAVQLPLGGVPGAADLASPLRGSGPGHQHRGHHRHDAPR